MSAAIARNAPCPCGSGKRFKDCHGAVNAPPDEPKSPDEFVRRAQVAFVSGQLASAKSLLERALELVPARADLLRERARIERVLGEAGAEASCRAALELAPRDVAAWNLLGEILNVSDPDAAEAAWRSALAIDAQDPEALFHLGNRLRERGEHAQAISHYERALMRAPGHAGVLNNLGLALDASGKPERAERCYTQVLAAQPQHADVLANLGDHLKSQQRYREAVLAYEKALTLRRDFPARFWSARGVALGELSALADAEASFREAARLEPDTLSTQVDLASVCIAREKFDEAEAPLARALELDPGNPYTVTMLAYSRMQCCAWDGLDSCFAQLRAALEDPKPRERYNVVPMPLLAMPLDADLEHVAARRWARQIRGAMSDWEALPTETRKREPGARLRVGFASSDFRDHAVARLGVECWERIDRSRIETFAYSLTPDDGSALRERAAHAFEHFVDVAAQPAAAIARRVREDGVEVLIDLNGYTTHARSEVFALKPAPVQASWLGYLGTLGAPWYDYFITDRFACPPESQAFFSERLLYLPDCYCPGDTKRAVASETPSRAACGLPEAGLVLCCFNNSYKILPELFGVWMRLLAALPGSVLWLAPSNATATANLRREAERRGVDPARLVLAPRVSLPEHLARHRHADLFLDTTPYNAGTTANDALFMGVPLVTCAGETMASRIAGSQLRAIGLPELITHSLSDYEALVLALGRAPERLSALKARLAANRLSAPLFDMARFTRALDDLLISAWENRRSHENL